MQQLCTQGRVPGAQKFGKSWAIPADTEKPETRVGRSIRENPVQSISGESLNNGMLKNDYFCETAGLGIRRNNIGAAGGGISRTPPSH